MRSSFYNSTRYIKGQKKGHYESYFQRANHPDQPLAFWIRYTIFSPFEHPENAIGELWAIFFNGNTNKHVSVKSEVSLLECSFNNSLLNIKVGDSFLDNKRLKGKVISEQHNFEWDLIFSGLESPMLLLPSKFYDLSFPKAKALNLE